MRNRGVILFLLGWIAVAALLFLWPAKPVRQTERAGVRDPDDLQAVSVVRGGTETALVRTGGVWRMTAPVAGDADAAQVGRLLDALAFRRGGDAISFDEMRRQRRSLADFGLDPAELEIRYRTADGGETLSLGRYTVSGREVYACMSSGRVLFTLPADVRLAADRDAETFLGRNVLQQTGEPPVSIALRLPGKKFVNLSRAENGVWRMTSPSEAPADPVAVRELERAFENARIVAFSAQETGVADISEYDNRVTVTFADAAGRGDTVTFGRDVSGTNLVYALVRNASVVVKLPKALRETCVAQAATLRDMRLFPVKTESVRSVGVTVGKTLWTLSRESAQCDWRLTAPIRASADFTLATALVSRVFALRQEDVVPAETNGAVEVSVTVATADPAASVATQSRHVSETLLEGLGNPANLRSREVLSFDRAAVRSIRVTSLSGLSFGADYDLRRGTWNGQGMRVRNEAVGRTVETLSRLQAESVENVAPSQTDLGRCGLLHPAFTLTADLEIQPSRVNLLFGNAAPGGGRYAVTGAKDVIFIVSATTVATLTQPFAE